METYMVFGVVAKYLSYIDSSKTLEENIGKLFFSEESLMFDEYHNLFRSLFGDKDARYKEIMDLLSSKKSGYNTTQIAEHLEIAPGQTIITLLDTLQQCGFIKSIATLGNKGGEYLYIVSDPYCLFYHDWLKGMSKNKIMNLPSDFWLKQVSQGKKHKAWSGFAFEMAVIINIHLFTKARGRDGVFKSVYSWNYRPDTNTKEDGAQIDLIVEYDNNNFDLVECKHWGSEFLMDKNEYNKILNKKEKFIQYKLNKNHKYVLNLVLLSSYGAKLNPYYTSLGISGNIKLAGLFL